MLPALLLTLCINAVPILGISFDNWGSASLLVIYWAENLVGSLLVAVRSHLHQQLTQKQGHFRRHFKNRGAGDRTVGRKPSSLTFTQEFLLTSLIFTVAHGLFLGIMLVVLKMPLQLSQVATGLTGMLCFQLLGFSFDTWGLRQRPFAWVKRQAQFYLGRIVLIHLAIIAGVWLAAFTDNARFLLPFALFKLLVDIGSRMSRGRAPKDNQKAPLWLIRLVNWLRPGDDFAAHLANEQEREAREAKEDEQERQAPSKR